jgi:hypothetical protein
LTANGVNKPPFTSVSFVLPEIVGEDNKVVWTSMYYTFDVFKPIIKEIFFQRVDVEDAKGNLKQFTQYHHEFNRWDNPPHLPSLSPEDDITVATLFLRATVASLKVKEWYPKGILDVAGAAGGFSTFLFFIGSVLYLLMHHVCPRRLRSYEELEPPVGMVIFDKFDKEAKAIAGVEVGMESASLSEDKGSAIASTQPADVNEDQILPALCPVMCRNGASKLVTQSETPSTTDSVVSVEV